MDKQVVTNFFKGIRSTVVEHSPEILTGIGIAGMITTTVLAVKATPKALRLIEAEKHDMHKDELTAIETVKVAWKPYIPAAVTGVTAMGCLIGAMIRNKCANDTIYVFRLFSYCHNCCFRFCFWRNYLCCGIFNPRCTGDCNTEWK